MPATATTCPNHAEFENCGCDRCRRASIAWRQRDQLARITRRHSTCWVDAEDAAQEAIVRALEAPELDCEQLPGWLTRVALNLCADLGRDQRRHHKRVRYQIRQEAAEPDVESVVIDRAYAHAMYQEALSLPAAQRSALLMRAEGRTVDEVAEALAISPKAAESLLSRARATLRRSAAFVAVVVAPLRRFRRTAVPVAATATAMSSILIFAVGGSSPYSDHHVLSVTRGTARDAVYARTPARTPAPTTHEARQRHSAAGRLSAADTRSAPRRMLVPPGDTKLGPAQVHDNGEGWTHPNQTLLESARACAEQGLAVTPQYIGCRAEQRSAGGRPAGTPTAPKDEAAAGVERS